MAQPSTELNTFRQRATQLLDALNRIDDVLATVEGSGTTDAQRIAFFSSVLTPEYDIDGTELGAAVIKIRELQTWVETNLPTLAKMRI
jgi:hypothetical protein